MNLSLGVWLKCCWVFWCGWFLDGFIVLVCILWGLFDSGLYYWVGRLFFWRLVVDMGGGRFWLVSNLVLCEVW